MGLSQHTPNSEAIFLLFAMSVKPEAENEAPRQPCRLVKCVRADLGRAGGEGQSTCSRAFLCHGSQFPEEATTLFCPLSGAFYCRLSIHPFSESIGRTTGRELSSSLYGHWFLATAKLLHFPVPRELSTCKGQGFSATKLVKIRNVEGRGFPPRNWLLFLSISNCFQQTWFCPREEAEALFYDQRVVREEERDGRRSNSSYSRHTV